MKKQFKEWPLNQRELFPSDPRDKLGERHPSRVLKELVSGMDMSEFTKSYRAGVGGQPPYSPKLMVSILLYGYSRGVYSSRELERACEERLDFQVLTDYENPDHNSIARFRARHADAMKSVFGQVLGMCINAGLVDFKHLAVDGTKIKANASIDKSKTYESIELQEDELDEEIGEWLEQAERADKKEDALHGDYNGYDVTPEMLEKLEEQKKLQAAKRRLEQQAKEQDEQRQREVGAGKKPRSHDRKKSDPEVLGRKKYNFSDPDSTVMKDRGRAQQCYNAQACADSKTGVIVAEDISANSSDHDQLLPMTKQVIENTGIVPRELSADGNYCSESNLEELERIDGINAYIAPRSEKRKKKKTSKKGTRVDAMRSKIARAGPRSRYRLRKGTIEPVFGHIKWNKGFKQFLLRGIEMVKAEWSLICSAVNVGKLINAITA